MKKRRQNDVGRMCLLIFLPILFFIWFICCTCFADFQKEIKNKKTDKKGDGGSLIITQYGQTPVISYWTMNMLNLSCLYLTK